MNKGKCGCGSMSTPVKKWSDVVSIISGKNQKMVQSPDGVYPIFGSGGEIGRASEFLCEAGTTIVGRKGTINNPIYVNERFWNVDTAFGICPGSELNSRYLYYFCKYFNFNELDKSTTIPSLAKRDLLKIEMPVPPLPEQERIAARIEELFSQLDAGVETLKKAKAQLAVYRQAVYTEAFSGIDNFDRITNYFEISGGLTKNSKRSSFPVKMPYLRVANVYYNYLDLEEIKEIGVKETEIHEKLLKQDDLLFVEGNGSKAQIGRVAIWDGSIDPCLHQNHIIKGRPNGKMLSKYALYYLISGFGRAQILQVASSTSGLYTLSTGKIENLRIPYCEISKQQMIVGKIEEKLSICDSIEQTVDVALQQAGALRQSILKQAFEGAL